MTDYACLIVPMPPSVNAIWRSKGKHVYRSDRYENWLTEAGWALKRQETPAITGHFTINLRFGPRRSNADLDNKTKAVLDLLETHKIIKSDSLADEIHLFWDDNVTGCQIEIEAVVPVAAKVSAARMT